MLALFGSGRRHARRSVGKRCRAGLLIRFLVAALVTATSQSGGAVGEHRSNARAGVRPTIGAQDQAADPMNSDWDPGWRRTGAGDWVLTGVAAALAVAFEYGIPESTASRWRGPILFDEPVRSTMVLHSAGARTRASRISDGLVVASVVQLTLIDSLLVPLVGNSGPDTAWELSATNLEAYSLTLAAATTTKHAARRERPYGLRCPAATGEYHCDGADRVHSFFSGHSAIAATGAGLSCAHHAMLGLYGDPVLDAASCAFNVSTALATGALRISSDKHWASDVVVGHMVGFSSGLLVPMLLRYRALDSEKSESDGPAVVVGLPSWEAGRVGIAMVGLF